jgi:hypothetical protein
VNRAGEGGRSRFNCSKIKEARVSHYARFFCAESTDWHRSEFGMSGVYFNPLEICKNAFTIFFKKEVFPSFSERAISNFSGTAAEKAYRKAYIYGRIFLVPVSRQLITPNNFAYCFRQICSIPCVVLLITIFILSRAALT